MKINEIFDKKFLEENMMDLVHLSYSENYWNKLKCVPV